MARKKALIAAMLALFILVAVALPALAQQDAAAPAAAGQGQQVQAPAAPAAQAPAAQSAPAVTTVPGASYADPVEKATGVGKKVEGLGAALIPIMLIVAGVALMFSGAKGKQLLVMVIAGAAIILGGWRLIVDVIRYLLQ